MEEMKEIVHYRGEQFTAKVEGYDNPVQCIPMVYESIANCGVGVLYKDGNGSVWGPMSPRNLIAAWRGAEILRHMQYIGFGTLHDAYTAGIRDPHESEQDTVNKVIAQIGKNTHDRIVQTPIPEEIVAAILEGQGRDFSPSLYPITEEVRAGTLKWRIEFEVAGVNHPDAEDAKECRRKAIIADHESLLVSYAKSRGLPRECFGMSYVEGALLTLVDKGMVGPKAKVVALSGLVGELATSEFAAFMIPLHRSREDYERLMNRQKQEAACRSAEWLRCQTSRRFWIFPIPAPSLQECEQELLDLFNLYFPPKKDVDGSEE